MGIECRRCGMEAREVADSSPASTSWQGLSGHAEVRGRASRAAVGCRSREPMSMKTIARRSGKGPPPVRGRACEARVLGSLTSVHAATHGGPRGNVPGRNDSMRTI